MSSAGNVRLFLGQPVGQRDCEWVGQQRGERTEKNEKRGVFRLRTVALDPSSSSSFCPPIRGQGLLLTEGKKLA